MKKITVFYLLLGISWIIAGCDLNGTAKEIALLRKSGEPMQAREKALAALEADADQMDVWRELAQTNLTLIHDKHHTDLDPLPLAVESALICGAWNAHKKGELNRKWEAVREQTVSEALTQANRLIYGIKVKDMEVEEKMSVTYLDPDGYSHVTEKYPRLVWKKVVDPEDLRYGISGAAAMMEFVKRLPRSVGGAAEFFEQIDRKITRLAEDHQLTDYAVGEIRKTAEDGVAAALQKAVEELDDDGHFAFDTIIGNAILQ